jgi:hypothetical protein
MLMRRDDGAPGEPLVSWMKREWLLVVITVGVAIDWLPFVLTPYLPPEVGPLSGTRLLVLPGLVFHTLQRPSWIRKPHVLGAAYLATILLGGGLGWLVGVVTPGRLTMIVVNGFVLIYYLQLRSLVSIRHVLAIVFVLSIIVPIVQCLARFGIITTDWLAQLGVVTVRGDSRVFSIFDSTTVGFNPLIIPACLGGLLFIRSPARRTARIALLAAGLVAFGVSSALVAQQRSGVLSYAAAVVAALALYVKWQRRQLIWLAVAFGLATTLAAYTARDVLTPAEERFSNVEQYEEAKDLRLGGLFTFFSDLAMNVANPVPIGHQSLLDRTGLEPHLLVSEAFYEGGPLFLAVILTILLRFGRACLRLARSADREARTVGNILCAFAAGAAIQVTIQTALGLRLVPLVIGVAIAGERIIRAQVPALVGAAAHDTGAS